MISVFGVVMSIWDRDYYVEHTLRKMGILGDKEKLGPNEAGPFNINFRDKKRELRQRRAGWIRLVLVVLVAAGLAGGLFVVAVTLLDRR